MTMKREIATFLNRCKILMISILLLIASTTISLLDAGTPGGLPPEGSVMPGEWEDMKAQIMSWPIGSTSLEDFFCQLIDNMQEYNEIWMIVSNATEEQAVRNSLTIHGVPLTNVIFKYAAHDAFWTRDYGPFYLRTALSERQMTDAQYYSTRWNDDVVPYRLAAPEGIPVHEARFAFEGGNFQSDGYGNCFFTEGAYDANPTMTREQVDQIFKDYFGCSRVTAVQRLAGEGTGHIDMFAKMLAPTKWLVGQYPSSDPNYQLLEDNAALLASLTAYNGQPYEVIRIPMPTTAASDLKIDYGSLLPRYDETKLQPEFNMLATWRTHTNSTIADQIVLVPIYGKGTDDQALQIYRDAMPDHTIVGIMSETIIPLGGAMHCVTMQVPEYPPYQGLAFNSLQELTEVVGNGNSTIEPGETWQFRANLENHGTEAADSVSAGFTINPSVSSGVRMLQRNALYATIPAGGIGTSLTPYRFALDGSYPCGTPVLFDLVDVHSSHGEDPDQPRSLTLTIGNETRIIRFQDDMESGSGSWTHASIDGAPDYWHLQTDPGCFEAESPITQWTFDKVADCNYSAGVRVAGHLTSQTISSITSSSTLFLGYWRETDFCSRLQFFPAKDFFRVQVSDNDFTTSTTLLELSCKQPSHAQWLFDERYSLSSFSGKNIKVRFLFDSSDGEGNKWKGIGIDDVLIEDRTYSCQQFIPPLPGEVPQSQFSPGEPLTLQKDGSNLIIRWGMECNEGYLTDYAIYRGTIAALSAGTWDHQQVVCTDAEADRVETIDAGTDSYYFIVVPNNHTVEGSYGSGAGGERPPASMACYAAGGGSCQ